MKQPPYKVYLYNRASLTLHNIIIESECDIRNDQDENESNEESMDIETPNVIDKNWENALFLLKITCEHSLSHEGVSKMSQSVQDYSEIICANAAERYVKL